MAAVKAVLHREARIRMTNYMFLFWDLFYPLGYLLVFGVGIDAAMDGPWARADFSYHDFFLAGVLGMASFGIASNTAWGFFVDRDNGIFYEMLTYPMSRTEFLGAKVAFNVLVALLQAFITVALAWWLLGASIDTARLPLLLPVVVVGTAGWFYFYSIFALRIRRNDIFNTVTSIFYFVFLFGSSMFYPLEPLPGWFRAVALANPITWHVDVLRFTTVGWGDPAWVLIEASGFVLFTAVSLALAVRAIDRQE